MGISWKEDFGGWNSSNVKSDFDSKVYEGSSDKASIIPEYEREEDQADYKFGFKIKLREFANGGDSDSSDYEK